jgi:hypothetical protein
MKLFMHVFFVLFLLQGAQALAGQGGEDPFPRACVNFSGLWVSDQGNSYGIQQQDCSKIQIQQQCANTTQSAMVTIIPDDKTRSLRGNSWTEQELYRWDQKSYGSSIQTYSTIRYSDRTVTAVVQMEIANPSLLLQTTYTKTTFDDGRAPQEQNTQEMFRRAAQ